MKSYELTYIITPEISSEEAEAKTGEVAALIQKNEGVVLKQTVPLAKALAYPIRKSASGFLGVLEFKIEPENLDKIQSTLSKDEKIVRQMLSEKKPLKPGKVRRPKAEISEAFRSERPSEEMKSPEHAKPAPDKLKVELKDIDKKLDELLGQ